MRLKTQLDDEHVRLRLFMIFALALFLALGGFIHNIQVHGEGDYAASERRQSIRRVRLPASRGRVLDRNGIVLARDKPSYCIALYIEELRRPGLWKKTYDNVERVIDSISETLRIERQITRRKIERHVYEARAIPLLAWKNIDESVLARWAEHPRPWTGVDIVVESVRDYPFGSLSAHVIGHVGRKGIDKNEMTDFGAPYNYFLPDVFGTQGIERAYNEHLTGKNGWRILRVDAVGYTHKVEDEKSPTPGQDVVLTLDARIQAMAEAKLKGQRGVCVVIDPRNGDVLAMATAPSYDLRTFRRPSVYKSLLADTQGTPLLNRPITGLYLPGSVFKPVVALAALVNGRATPQTRFHCNGAFTIGNRSIKCWLDTGHGEIGMRKAIEQSCNSYFIELAMKCGYERIYHMAEALGFGQKTKVGLSGESSGLLPDDAWKRRRKGVGWLGGDTANAAIGQGYLLVTPLQMAVFTATIANGGYVYRPRLMATHKRGQLVNDMGWDAETIGIIRDGMTDVVQAERGTAWRARIEGVTLAGKTGSAEYGPKNAKKFAWMILFGPVELPRYAVAMVIEDGLSGGRTAAPLVRELMEDIFNLDGTRKRPKLAEARN